MVVYFEAVIYILYIRNINAHVNEILFYCNSFFFRAATASSYSSYVSLFSKFLCKRVRVK